MMVTKVIATRKITNVRESTTGQALHNVALFKFVKPEIIVSPLTRKLVKKLWCIYATEYSLSSKRNQGSPGYIFIFKMQEAK